MKVMSFNVRGLAGPHRSALKHVVSLEHPDIIIPHETLGLGDVLKERL